MFKFRIGLAICVGFSAFLCAQEASLTAPPLATAKSEKKPGLTVTFTAGGKTDTRPARLVALFVPAGQAATPFLPAGPFTARFEAEIVSELRAAYTFSVETTGVVTATLNGVPLLDSRQRADPAPAPLQKGANRLVVEFESPAQGDAMLRLMWAGKDFPREPVPPGVFQHDASETALRTGERLREGRMLFAQNRCAACHDAGPALPPRGEGLTELAQDAPLLDNVGGKFHEAWLAAWIQDPHRIRPQTLMPKVFAGAPEKSDSHAADLAAFFASAAAPLEGPAVDLALADQGGALFANLGCVACHSKPDADGPDAHDRVPLAHVRAKWQPAALVDYLREPSKNYAWTRMPHFRLDAEEAGKLAAYLLGTAAQEFPLSQKGDAARGAQLLTAANCLNCHAGLPPTTTPTLAATLKSGWTRGCLAPDDAQRGAAPDFAFTPAQREALSAFAAHGFEPLKQDAPAEFAERQVKNLRCNACHAVDSQPSVWSQLEEEIIALQSGAPLEEGEGRPIHTTALPPLTWFGEKLRSDYLVSFIAGQPNGKPRPWMLARMPGFGAHAEPLAAGLTQQHGVGLQLAPEPAPAEEMVKIGETLLGENGGFNCLQCHALGERPPTAVFEAPGPNLALTPRRLRKEYFHRWVLAPTRIDPETKMPKFADDQGRTPLTEFYEGHASAQFEAIWQALQVFRK